MSDIHMDDEDFHEESDSHNIDVERLKQQVREFSQTPKLDKGLKKLVESEKEEVNKEYPGFNIGTKLVSGGYITKDQLEIALREQKESHVKKEIGTILVELDFITDSMLAKALAETSGVESVDLKHYALKEELIRMIPRSFAMQYKVIPLELTDTELKVATSDVYNLLGLDQLKKYFAKNVRIKPYFANEFQITEVIDLFFDYEMDIQTILKEIETGHYQYNIEDNSYVNPTVRLVDSILMDAIKQNASDIHFEPESEFVRVRYRMDGILIEMVNFHKEFWSAISVRIKVMAGLNIAETRNPQDGRFLMNFMGRKVDFRLSTMPTIHGENIVLRVLDRKKSLLDMDALGLTADQINLLKRLLKRPEGIVILTGPTGSGKTTTLYSMLSLINSSKVNILTLEDPVEYQLPIIRQSSVREGTQMNFSNGIRTMMRQDPDVIFVGEVRDNETALMSVRAAMTGHQVFTTLHTNDAIGAIPRLIDLGIRSSILAGSIITSIAQRLVRKLCIHCKMSYTPNDDEARFLGIRGSNRPSIYRKVGCPKCNNIGYKGRIAIFEILPVDREFDDLIARDATRKEMMRYARSSGFKLLEEEAIEKVLNGTTSIEEIIDNIDMTERLRNADLQV